MIEHGCSHTDEHAPFVTKNGYSQLALITLLILVALPSITLAKENALWLKRAKVLRDPAATQAFADAIKAAAANAAAKGQQSFSATLPRRAAETKFSASSPLAAPPAPGQWAPAGNMATQRAGHTATRLPDGRILVAGGFDDNIDTLNSADLYNPTTNTWSAAAPMNVARSFHTATLLMDGRVLVAGGSDQNDNSLTSVEIYNPVANTWTNVTGLGTARDAHTATLLSDGKVLVAGGQSVTGLPSPPGTPVLIARNTSEIYDVGANTWTPTAGNLATARENHTATLLPNGQVLVVGGDFFVQGPTPDNINTNTLASAERFDPAAGTWSSANSMSTPRLAHTATLLHNGKVLVVAGNDFQEVNNVFTFTPLLSVDLYDPASNTWSPAAPLPVSREDHTATLLPDGRVLVAAGEYYNPTPTLVDIALQTSIVYIPQTNTWVNDATLITPRDGHTATLFGDNTRVLATGGINFDFSDSQPSQFEEVLASTEFFNAPIQLIYNTPLRDKVQQIVQTPTGGGGLDPTFTVIYPSNAPAKTITSLRFDSTLGGIWDTTSSTFFWTLGAANGLDSALLNNGSNATVNFPIAPGGSFALFASEWTLGAPFTSGLFQPGQEFILTIGFSDATTATASVVIPAVVPPTVTVTAPTPNASEAGPANGTFRLARTGPTTAPLKVNYTVTGSATNGVDYTALPGSAVIPAGFSTVDVTVTPLADASVEGPETVILTVATDPNYTLGAPISATVTIADDPPALPVVTVNATAPIAAEGGSNGIFTVSRTGSTAAPLTVFFSLSGTATAPGNPNADYSLAPSSTSVTIGVGFSTADVTLTPVDDSFPELSETAILTITPNLAYTVGSPGSATVNIADNEPTVTVTAQTPNAAEGGANGVFRISRTPVAASPLTVNFALSGSATIPGSPGADYSLTPLLTPTSVEIPGGQTFVDVTLTPVDDASFEPTETATLTLAAGTYTIGAPANATVNIADNDPAPVLTLTYAGVQLDRVGQNNLAQGADGNNDPAFTVNVPATGSARTIVSMRLDSSLGGTWDTIGTGGNFFWTLGAAASFAGALFNAPNDSVSIPVPAGGTSFVIFASDWFLGPPFPAGLFQPGQTFTLKITYSDNSMETASATIPSLPIVTVAAQTPNAAEGGANGVYRITRIPVDVTPLTVNFTLSGSATIPGSPGADYSLASLLTPTSVQILGGQTFVDVTLTPVDDSLAEPTETATLTLGAGVGYVVGAPASATVNIADNEPTVTVTAQAPNAAEGGATGLYRISRTPVAASPLTVNFTLSGSATIPGSPGADYSLASLLTPTSVQILGGQTFVDVTLTPVDDSLAEPTETATLTIAANPSYTVGSPSNATVNIADNDVPTLTFAGLQTDQVGQNNLTRMDSAIDPAFTVVIPGTGSARTITALRMDSTLGGIWDTQGGTFFWTLGAANTFAGPLLNAGNDSVSIAVSASGITFVVFTSDWTLGPPFPAGLFQSGQGFTLTITYSDATTQTVSTVIP